MHIRVWQRRFFAFTDVVDTLVVAATAKQVEKDNSKLIHWLFNFMVKPWHYIFMQGNTLGNIADPRRLTKRSSAALWMWKTSSLKRQRQELLCRASFHKLRAVGSLFRAAWHRINPTAQKQNDRGTPQRVVSYQLCYTNTKFREEIHAEKDNGKWPRAHVKVCRLTRITAS